MKRYQKLLNQESVSQSGCTRSDFEFPTTTSLGVQQNDVVFCGKVITRRAESSLAPHQIQRQRNNFVAGLRSPSGRENWCLRSGSDSGRKIYTGMFGTVKFPLQMGLSDIKMRQERREPMSLPKLSTEDCGSKSCWEMVRPLRRKGTLMSALKASFGRIRFV